MPQRFFMNKQRGKHLGASDDELNADAQPSGDVSSDSGQHEAPDIHIASHANGHTIHVTHKDGRSESHEHPKGDIEGVTSRVKSSLGGAMGQDHGGSSGDEMENETGYGPGV